MTSHDSIHYSARAASPVRRRGSSRTIVARTGIAAAALVFGAGLAGCGGGSGEDDVRSDIVGMLVAEDDLPREQAECMADVMIGAGFTAEDFAAVDAFDGGAGARVSSRIYDMTVDAASRCVPGFVPNEPTFG